MISKCSAARAQIVFFSGLESAGGASLFMHEVKGIYKDSFPVCKGTAQVCTDGFRRQRRVPKEPVMALVQWPDAGVTEAVR